MTLLDVVADAAAELDGVQAAPAVEGMEWRRAGRPFAAVAGDAAEFRLDPLVANAALRTPDTTTSERGVEWVHFSPAVLDGHAIDRARAWLVSAWRRAASQGS